MRYREPDDRNVIALEVRPGPLGPGRFRIGRDPIGVEGQAAAAKSAGTLDAAERLADAVSDVAR